jgi:hypothetical protein
VTLSEEVPGKASAVQPVIGVTPSKNSTLPVGLPVPGELAETVAVYVTAWPTTEGFEDDATKVVVLALFTAWDIDGDTAEAV